MPPEALLLALGSAFIHASWNAFAKARVGDRVENAYLIGFGAGLIGLLSLPIVGLPSKESLRFMAISASVSALYYPLLGYTYRVADMSATYPLIRGGAPLFTALLGTAFLGEVLAPESWGGVLLLSAGVLGLGAEGLLRGGVTGMGLLTAAAASAVIVTNNLVDAQGSRLSGNSTAYVLAGNVVTMILLTPIALRTHGRTVFGKLKANLPFALFAGLMVNASYALVAAAMVLAPVGLVAAMRETSVLIGTVIAALVLKEKFGPLRWAGAFAIVAGLLLIRLG